MADRGSTTETLSTGLYATRVPGNTINYFNYGSSWTTTFTGVKVSSGTGSAKVKVWSVANNRWELAPSS